MTPSGADDPLQRVRGAEARVIALPGEVGAEARLRAADAEVRDQRQAEPAPTAAPCTAATNGFFVRTSRLAS